MSVPAAATTTKAKREPKFKSKIRVQEGQVIVGECSCGWVGNRLSTRSDLSLAMASVQSEIQAHKHLPQPKKERKKK